MHSIKRTRGEYRGVCSSGYKKKNRLSLPLTINSFGDVQVAVVVERGANYYDGLALQLNLS